MTARSNPSSPPPRRRGVTLIEVVAGLVVLAVLVSAVTVARGRFARQWADSRKKLDATAAVDRMLAGWAGTATTPDTIPVPAQGPLEGAENCAWRTTLVPNPPAHRLGSVVVRLEVFENRRRLLTIDVLKHVRPRAETEAR